MCFQEERSKEREERFENEVVAFERRETQVGSRKVEKRNRVKTIR